MVIDEAAQAVEPSTLVPLCYGAKQVRPEVLSMSLGPILLCGFVAVFFCSPVFLSLRFFMLLVCRRGFFRSCLCVVWFGFVAWRCLVWFDLVCNDVKCY